MAGVMCPRCGAVSPTEARVCPKCGSNLTNEETRTRASKPLEARRPVTGSLRRPQNEGDTTSPDDTVTDEEQNRRRPVATPAASSPRAKPKATGARPAVEPLTSSRDGLIGRKLQEYVLESRLGVGGMGVVYKAVQPMIGKHVAIKVLRPDVVQDPRDIDRLLEEARVVSSIKHRGIINIFGAGTLDDGRHYLIMELLEGESLEQLMAREGTVPVGDAVLILEQTLSALAAAHEAGIVHRDLKPANIFLVKEANQLYVKLLDFGLARRQSQHVTRIAGTPDYISPEHARGRPAGPPADLYSFGVLCFHMLTGRLPFIGTTPMEVMEKHVHSAPPVPHEVTPSIPKALSELILRLLAKDPGARPDAMHVKADLRAATRQMRSAPTMMSLMAVEAVPDNITETEDQRAKTLARDAHVADLKRKVKRRWPLVLGGSIGVWFLGVLIYVLWPSPAPTPSLVKRPVVVDAGLAPRVAVAKPDEPTHVPVEVPDFPGVAPELDAAIEVPVAVAEPEEDSGEPASEDINAVIDDVRLGELRRQHQIDEHLEQIEATIKYPKNAKLRSMFEGLTKNAREACDRAQTMRQFHDCDDLVEDLRRTFENQVLH